MNNEFQKTGNLDRMITGRVASLVPKGKREPFAKRVGIDGAAFRKLLNGKKRWISWHIEAVARGLEIDPADLIRTEEEPKRRLLESEWLRQIKPTSQVTYVTKEELFLIYLIILGVRSLADGGDFRKFVIGEINKFRELGKTVNLRFSTAFALNRRKEKRRISFRDRRQEPYQYR